MGRGNRVRAVPVRHTEDDGRAGPAVCRELAEGVSGDDAEGHPESCRGSLCWPSASPDAGRGPGSPCDREHDQRPIGPPAMPVARVAPPTVMPNRPVQLKQLAHGNDRMSGTVKGQSGPRLAPYASVAPAPWCRTNRSGPNDSLGNSRRSRGDQGRVRSSSAIQQHKDSSWHDAGLEQPTGATSAGHARLA